MGRGTAGMVLAAQEKETVKVIIADDNRDLCHMLTRFLEKQEGIEVQGVANSGEEVLERLWGEGELPDVLILDLIMPRLDGIAVLEKMALLGDSRPRVIVLSALGQEGIVRRALELGADYYMVKPFNLDVLARRIRELAEKRPAEPRKDLASVNLESRVTALMHELGIPAHIRGYLYLREAIVLSAAQVEYIGAVTKELYPTIARKYGTLPARVERAIRHAIEVAFSRGNAEVLQKFFGHTVNPEKGKPTNAEFIALLADRLRMEYGS